MADHALITHPGRIIKESFDAFWTCVEASDSTPDPKPTWWIDFNEPRLVVDREAEKALKKCVFAAHNMKLFDLVPMEGGYRTLKPKDVRVRTPRAIPAVRPSPPAVAQEAVRIVQKSRATPSAPAPVSAPKGTIKRQKSPKRAKSPKSPKNVATMTERQQLRLALELSKAS